MKKPVRPRERGFTIVFTAAAMVVLLGMSALAIDGGVMFTAKNQLQNAVDAAALAGASGLILDQQEAVNRAITIAARNECIDQTVVLSAGDVSFPSPGRVQVSTQQTVNLFFARVLGMNTATIGAMAVAELNALSGTSDVKPWAVPFFDYVFGDPVLLKQGSIDGEFDEYDSTAETPNSWYNAVCFPPLNVGTPETGADVYRENITTGSQDQLHVGDRLQVETGNMVGPTQQGVTDLIALDPNAHWDSNLGVVDSAYPGSTSPRIIKIIFYDPALPPTAGRGYVDVVGFGAFFLEGTSGQRALGRFIQMLTSGTFGSGPGPSLLKGVRLIQ